MISIGYITSRPEPRFDWLMQSLGRLLKPSDEVELILVDSFAEPNDGWTSAMVQDRARQVSKAQSASGMKRIRVSWVPPKPTVWSGPYRVTRDNWWSAASSRNTALCLARGDYWVMLDDRCVLQHEWMDGLRAAEAGQYAVCGPYQKRSGITVEDGVIKHAGIVTGEDSRLEYCRTHYMDPKHQIENPYKAPGSWFFGCCFGVPMEWALQVNGFAEDYCDSLSAEDYVFGNCIEANGWPILYDVRMAIIEDRTPECLGPPIKRTDKGVSPHDKSHKVLEIFKGSKTSKNSFEIRQLRKRVLAGEPFPLPIGPRTDWYDGSFVSSF